MQRLNLVFLFIIITMSTLLACTRRDSSSDVAVVNSLGSAANPIKFYLIPAQDLTGLDQYGKVLQKYLEKDLGLSVSVEVPLSYIAVVEAFGANRADVAILNTLGYVLAKEKYQVDCRLKLVNRGRDEYWGQIIARVDGPANLQQLKGKKFAFVDPASTSGYLLPARLFKSQGIAIGEKVFSGRHDTVVNAVYQRQVDAGATFYTPPDADGTPKDARILVKTQYPDVFEKIKILQLTGPIPNDPVVFRKDLPEELKTKIVDSLVRYIKTDEGKETLHKLYHITDFKKANDKDYDKIREYLKDVGQTAEAFVK